MPIVDTDELRNLVLDAAITGGNGTAVIEIPIIGSEAVDRGADELIAEAHRLTKNGIALRVPGVITRRRVSQSALRSWLVFGGTIDEPTISLDEQLAQSTVETLFIDYGDAGDEPTFTVDPAGRARIVGSSLAQSAAPSTRLSESWRGWKQASGSLNSDHERIPMSGHRMGQVTRHRRGDRRVHDQLPAEPDPEHQHPAHRRAHPGAVIEPGGEFSINDYVGRRTRENGFVDAGVILNGVFTTSVGGGISQYATTLFNAAFFAGLDFGDYQSHSIYLSRYPYGREATVNFPNVDLEILNTTPYGVLLWPITDETSITVTLYGTRWVEGEQTGQTERRQGVSCTRVTTERTRTYLEDGRTETDTVFALYRPEGVRCDGSPSDPAARTTTTTTTTTSTVPPSTTVP